MISLDEYQKLLSKLEEIKKKSSKLEGVYESDLKKLTQEYNTNLETSIENINEWKEELSKLQELMREKLDEFTMKWVKELEENEKSKRLQKDSK